MNFKNRYILNSFFKRSGMWTLAKVAQAGITFLIFYIYAVFLGKEDYGIYQKAFVLNGLFSSLFSFGLYTYIPALPLEYLEKIIGNIIRKAGIFILLVIIVVSTVIYFVLPEFPVFAKILLLILSLLNALNLIYEIYALKHSRDKFIFRLNVIFSILYLIVHVVLLNYYALSVLLLILIFLSFSRLVIAYINSRGFEIVSSEIDDKPINFLYSQWYLTVFNETLELVSKYIDKIILVVLLAAQDFAVYFNGSYELPLLGLLVSAAGTFINVHTIEHNLSNKGIKNFFHIETIFLASIVFPIFFFAWFYAIPLFSWLFNNKYNEAVPFFLIYAWVIPLRIANYTAILQQKLKVRLITIGSVSALIIKLILMFILYPLLGARGIAVACVVGTFYQIVFYLYYTSKSLVTPFYTILPFKRLLFIFLVCLSVNGLFYWYFRSFSENVQVIFGSITAAICSIVIVLFYTRRQIEILNMPISIR